MAAKEPTPVMKSVAHRVMKVLAPSRMKGLDRVLRTTDGAEIAEAAVVLPVAFLFLMGIVWFGRAFNIYSTIQQAAQQGAIAAARPTCATCSSTFGGTTAVDNAVSAVMQASSVDPSQIINPGAGTSPCTTSAKNITVCQQVVLSATPPLPSPLTSCGSPPDPSPAQFCGMLVTFQYPFTFYLTFTSLNMNTIRLTAQAQTRMEN